MRVSVLLRNAPCQTDRVKTVSHVHDVLGDESDIISKNRCRCADIMSRLLCVTLYKSCRQVADESAFYTIYPSALKNPRRTMETRDQGRMQELYSFQEGQGR